MNAPALPPLHLRAEVVIHLPSCWTPQQHLAKWNQLSEPMHTFLEEMVEMAPEQQQQQLFADLPGLEDVVAIEDEDEQGEALGDWVQRRAPQGFLVNVAVPRRDQRYSSWYWWVHAETVPAAIAKAMPWAQQLRREGLA